MLLWAAGAAGQQRQQNCRGNCGGLCGAVRQGRHGGKRKLTVRSLWIIIKSSYEVEQGRGWSFGQLTLSGGHRGLYLLFDGSEPGGE